ncbi:hypothetical protein COO60DRAFT_1523258 [Scenedesmus sp. NREL 46B-D3]|nr:hypothetical protein COO60DRAFT_1523258 [Scenedesmus sp. NREL 46B-D3]
MEAKQQTKQVVDEVNQLLVQLPQAKDATETFSLFASSVQHIFEGLQHLSILLLPCDPAASGSSTAAAAGSSASAKAASGRAGTKQAQAACGGSKQGGGVHAQAGEEQQAFNSRLQAFRAGCGLDWSNCCVFRLYPGRGPVVQPHPSWPVACTATCYAAGLAEKGCVSMAAVPMFSCNRPVAVLCLASDQLDAFADVDTLKLLGGVLAPYCSMLEFTTRRMEMQRLVNEIITPIAAQLAQQKHGQLARLGCTGISVAVGGHGRSSGSSRTGAAQAAGDGHAARGRLDAALQLPPLPGSIGVGPAARKGKGCGGKAAAAASAAACAGQGAAGKALKSSSSTSSSTEFEEMFDGAAGSGKPSRQGKEAAAAQGITHKRFESVIVKSHPCDADSFGGSPDLDLDWSDFFFNLVSMAIVYVYFSKAAVAGESLVAILLCMGVAAFDIVLLVMRWLWFEQYINYGSIVLSVFQAYRVVVLPVANTWMSWSLLNKMSVTPSWGVVAVLGLILLACIAMGLQVRFFLHAPLQLASVLFAATSTPDICGAFFDSTSSLRCIGIISAVQLSLGLVLPSLMVYLLEGRSRRAFLPHMQAKRWLLHP